MLSLKSLFLFFTHNHHAGTRFIRGLINTPLICNCIRSCHYDIIINSINLEGNHHLMNLVKC